MGDIEELGENNTDGSLTALDSDGEFVRTYVCIGMIFLLELVSTIFFMEERVLNFIFFLNNDLVAVLDDLFSVKLIIAS